MRRSKYQYIGSIRPIEGLYVGFQFFDTVINRPIWWDGEKWVDSNGVDV